jgi:thiol-disulfide isomerase/thioredoxin
MAKKSKCNAAYKTIEIMLIVTTLIIGGILVFLFSKTPVPERMIGPENFQGSDKKLLLFYAPWCGASKSFLPTWDKLKNNSEINTETYDVDLDENKQISEEYNIKFLPTLYLVKGGEKIKHNGGRDEASLIEFVNNN